MKIHRILLFFFLSLIIFSCKKDKTEDSDKQVFLINGVSDLTIEPNGTMAMGLEIKQVSGKQSTVNLSVSGVPSNITSSFSSTSGTPTFGSSLTFSAEGAAEGTYTIKLSGNNGLESKDYSFNLHVRAPEECTDAYLGVKNANDDCGGTYNVSISKTPGYMNRITINDLGNFVTPISVYANLNCLNNTIDIPLQASTLNRKINGNGTFTSNQLTINYTVTFTDDGSSEDCMVIIE